MSRTPSSARRFAGPRIVAVTMLVMTAAFGLNFATGVFLAPLSARYGWGVGALSMAVSSLLLWRLAGPRDPLPPATPTAPTPTSPVIA